MNDRIDRLGSLHPLDAGPLDDADNTISPLAGEPGLPNVAEGTRTTFSRKGLLAVLLLTLMLIAVIAVGIQRFAASGKKGDDGQAQQTGDRPAAASAEPRKLDLPIDLRRRQARQWKTRQWQKAFACLPSYRLPTNWPSPLVCGARGRLRRQLMRVEARPSRPRMHPSCSCRAKACRASRHRAQRRAPGPTTPWRPAPATCKTTSASCRACWTR